MWMDFTKGRIWGKSFKLVVMPNDNFLPLHETNEGISGKKIKHEKTWKNRHTIKSKHECKGMKKCWNYHYHLVKKETKSDEEKKELYYDTATLNLKETFVTIL